MRLIDADALIESIEHNKGKNSIYAQYVRAYTKCAPTIDAVPIMHGDWKEQKLTFNDWGGDVVTEKTLWRCSVCGHEDSILTNYCSKCGARMDGDKE